MNLGVFERPKVLGLVSQIAFLFSLALAQGESFAQEAEVSEVESSSEMKAVSGEESRAQDEGQPQSASSRSDQTSNVATDKPGSRSQRAFPEKRLASEAVSPEKRLALERARELFPWLTSEGECGQSCMYQRANDTLLLKMVYLQSKHQQIEEGVQSLSGDRRDQFIQRTLGREFCAAMGASRDAEQCYISYKQMTALELPQIYKAYVKNQRGIGDLESRASFAREQNRDREVVFFGESGRPPRVVKSSDRPGQERQPYTPELPTVSELSALYQMDETGRTIEQLVADFDAYLEAITTEPAVPLEPVLSDFVKFRTIFRNPLDPSAGTVRVADRSCGEEVCFDKAAHAQALAIFRGEKEGSSGNRAERVRSRYERYRETAQRAIAEVLSDEEVRTDLDVRRLQSIENLTLAQRALYRARNMIISTAERVLGAQSSDDLASARQPTEDTSPEEGESSRVPASPGKVSERGSKAGPSKGRERLARAGQAASRAESPTRADAELAEERAMRNEATRPLTPQDLARRVVRPIGNRTDIRVGLPRSPELGLDKEASILDSRSLGDPDQGYPKSR